MRAIVCGYIATYPVGGVAWDYGHYVLALEDLGFEVFYLEDTGIPVDSETGDTAAAAAFLDRSLTALSPAMHERWHLRDWEGHEWGMSSSALRDVVRTADLFLNVSGACLLREQYRETAQAVYLDTDPGWNHFDRFPRADALAEAHSAQGIYGFREHDHHFTYASNLGGADCALPDMGLTWHPTRPPVTTRLWQPVPPGARWTTVMTWDNFGRPIEHEGRSYGSKEREFDRIVRLPDHGSWPLEVAVDPERAPTATWRERGWLHTDSRAISESHATYRGYISSSRGEFSVAKNVYVDTRSGWFSCRSTCYLASGRPVVVQDTGTTDLPTGAGLMFFHDLADAAAALAAVEESYNDHAAAARVLAEDCFEGRRVLECMLADMTTT